jgi:hypothetical protein
MPRLGPECARLASVEAVLVDGELTPPWKLDLLGRAGSRRAAFQVQRHRPSSSRSKPHQARRPCRRASFFPGSVNLESNAFRLRVSFRNRADGSILWANSYDGETRVYGILEAQTDTARNIVIKAT